MRIKLQENFHHLSGRLNRDRAATIIDAAIRRHDMRRPEILCQFESYKAYFRLGLFWIIWLPISIQDQHTPAAMSYWLIFVKC